MLTPDGQTTAAMVIRLLNGTADDLQKWRHEQEEASQDYQETVDQLDRAIERFYSELGLHATILHEAKEAK